MKKIIFLAIMLLGFSIFRANAQFVKAKPAFSVGISVVAAGLCFVRRSRPDRPRMDVRGNRYVEVPGYWARPGHYHRWVNGHWKYTKRG